MYLQNRILIPPRLFFFSFQISDLALAPILYISDTSVQEKKMYQDLKRRRTTIIHLLELLFDDVLFVLLPEVSIDLFSIDGLLPHFRPCADTLEKSSFQIFK